MCRLSDKDQEETQASTRAVHILQVGRERGWVVPRSSQPAAPQAAKGSLLLGRGTCPVKTAGVWSGTGARAPVMGEERLRRAAGVQNPARCPRGPGMRGKCAGCQPRQLQGISQYLLSRLRNTSGPLSPRVPPSTLELTMKEQQRRYKRLPVTEITPVLLLNVSCGLQDL